MMATEYTGEVIPTVREYTGDVVSEKERKPKGRALSVLDVVAAGPENVASLASGALAAPVSGLAGIGAAATNALGLTNTPAADVVKKVQQAMTYQPRTQISQGLMGAAGMPMEALAKVGGFAGDKTLGMTNSPLLAAGVDTAVQALPMLLNRGGRGAAERNMEQVKQRLAIEQSQNEMRDANFAKAKEAGYVIPTAMAPEKSMVGATVESAPGKIKMQQAASVKNQEVTNKLAREDMQLPEGAEITPDRLAQRRSEVYKQFQDDLGGNMNESISPTQTYYRKMQQIFNSYFELKKQAPKTFASSEIEGLYADFQKNFQGKEVPTSVMTKEMEVPSKTTGSVIDSARELRSDATRDLKTQDNASKARLGKLKIQVADALDDLLEENFRQQGNYKAVGALRQMREGVAKTYDYERALNWANYDISAAKMAALADKRPLSGNAKQIATFYKQFPKAAQDVSRIGSQPYFSPWDTAFAIGSAVVGHPGAAVAEVGARGALPKIALSNWFQNKFANTPAYQPGLGARTLMGATNPAALPFMVPPAQFLTIPEDQQ